MYFSKNYIRVPEIIFFPYDIFILNEKGKSNTKINLKIEFYNVKDQFST